MSQEEKVILRNKSIRQNWKVFNNIKFRPLGEMEESAPRDKKSAALWAEKMWKHIALDELQRHSIFVKRGKGTDKYTISVWSDEDTCYLIACVRSEFNTDSTTVYTQAKSESNIQDFINLAKFIHKNVAAITNDAVKAYKRMDELLQEKSVKEMVAKA